MSKWGVKRVALVLFLLGTAILLLLWRNSSVWSWVPSELPVYRAIPSVAREAAPGEAKWLGLPQSEDWTLAVYSTESGTPLAALLLVRGRDSGTVVLQTESIEYPTDAVFAAHLVRATDPRTGQELAVAWGWVLDKRAALVDGFTNANKGYNAKVDNGFWLFVRTFPAGEDWSRFQARTGRYAIIHSVEAPK